MTPKELYIHITSQMTAEDALLKLLEGAVVNYEKLKFNEGEEIHPVYLITMAALDMDWQIAIPNTADDDEELTGMVVGTEEYLAGIFSEEDDEERLTEALNLLQYFVDRVEAGTIRSKTTYKKYKDFLDNINKE